MFRINFKSASFLALLASSCLVATTRAMTTYPGPIKATQPDGTEIEIFDNGDEQDSWLSDSEGYTIEQVEGTGEFVYVDEDSKGNLVQIAGSPVGKNKRPGNLKKRLRNKNKDCRRQICGSPHRKRKAAPAQDNILENQELIVRRGLGERNPAKTTGDLRNLVVLLHFKDHAEDPNRSVPSQEDIGVLFNSEDGGSNTIAPTGSIKEFFAEASDGQLNVTSTVVDWYVTSQTELYYANRNYGRTIVIQKAIKEALDYLESTNFDFAYFDQDGDGYIDAFTVLHSGYDAATFGDDCFQQTRKNRIWSHKWDFWAYDEALDEPWYIDPWQSTASSILVDKYHISPAKWGICGDEIGHIGVIVHETGHFLDIPDLYDPDTSAGRGLDSWDVMANSWGWDWSQRYPPHFSAWSKLQLGWATAVVPQEGVNEVAVAGINSGKAEIYKIGDGQYGFPVGEYLLIENRQQLGFDQLIEGPGLAIYHIDEAKSDDLFFNAGENEGYPGHVNRKGGSAWPENNKHYHTALLQADGNYDLEQGRYSDSGDLFYEGGVTELMPSDSVTGGPFPNTDSYQEGNLLKTRVGISSISASGNIMTFVFDSNVAPAPTTSPAPSTSPSESPTASPVDAPVCQKRNQPCTRQSECCDTLRCNTNVGLCKPRRALRGEFDFE